MTDRDVVDTVGNGLAAEFDAQSVIAGVFDRIVNAERPVAVVFDVDVHVTVIKTFFFFNFNFNFNSFDLY